MIEFPCRCGFVLSVPAELSGGVIQCPQCKKLADVPGAGDLENLEEDGTIKIDSEPPKPDAPETIQKMKQAFLPARDKEYAEQVDLRPSMEDILKAGSEEVPLEFADQVRPGAPKYDPETGELIQPMDLKPPRPTPAIPVEAISPQLSYARDFTRAGVLPHMVPFALFRPANAVVMVMLFLLHVFKEVVVLFTSMGMIFAALAAPFTLLLIMAHYSNVVEEVGPYERDEMPAPGRSWALGEDLWRPFCNLFAALGFCYLPAFALTTCTGGLLLQDHPAGWIVVAALLAVATFFFPAVFLILSASATWRNLRPDRLMGTIRECGASYLPIVMLWLATSIIYGAGFWFATAFAFAAGRPGATANKATALGYPLLFVGIYLMHMFCWYLGLLYRGHEDKFPWMLQRHVPTRKIERRIPPRRKHRPAAAAPTPVVPLPDIPGQVQGPSPIAPRPVTPLPVTPLPVQPLPLTGDRQPASGPPAQA